MGGMRVPLQCEEAFCRAGVVRKPDIGLRPRPTTRPRFILQCPLPFRATHRICIPWHVAIKK